QPSVAQNQRLQVGAFKQFREVAQVGYAAVAQVQIRGLGFPALLYKGFCLTQVVRRCCHGFIPVGNWFG
ncbi:MAG: hypothetical protein KDH98_24240, partial [Calditrichaeota bacterium]|nr:hypothetical protein [Calditrichota bacterium]